MNDSEAGGFPAEVEIGSVRAKRSRAERSESPNRLRTGARAGSQVFPGVQGESRLACRGKGARGETEPADGTRYESE